MKNTDRNSTVRPADRYTMAYRIILRENPNKPGEYVTHLQTLPNMGRNHGHYFDNYEDALKDFELRCQNAGVSPVETVAA